MATMARLWIVFSLLVVCGSIYPFDFQPRPLDLAELRAFLASCCRPLVWREGLSSVLLFVPFGFLGVAAARPGSSLFARLVLVTLLGLLLALALQVAQVYLPSRPESLQDAGWNALGVVAGGLLGAAVHRYTRGSLGRLPGGRRRASAGSGYVPVTVNFRSRTVVILENVAREVGCDLPALCRVVLDAHLGEAEGGSLEADSLTTAAVKKLMHSVPQEEAGASAGRKPVELWQKRTIELTRAQFLKVRNLADHEEQSLSRTIRHIIADFLEDRADPRAEARALKGLPTATRRSRDGDSAVALSRRERKAARANVGGQFVVVFLAVTATSVIFAFGDPLFDRAPRVLEAVPWAGKAAQIVFDHHTHTGFSGGALGVEALVALAKEAGCNALAITDHSGVDGAGSTGQLDALARLRRKNPELLLFGGAEIAMPSDRHLGHASVIVHPAVEQESLARLKRSAADPELLRLETVLHDGGSDLLMVYNHPRHKGPGRAENYDDMLRWNLGAEGRIFVGFAGAPGQQDAAGIGDYQRPLATIDGWHLAVAEVGGGWDELLAEGHQVWGALAGSDFHSRERDELPCEFARTHVAAPEFSYAAVLQALRAGSFWADHGRILDLLSFSAVVENLEKRVYPGSVVSLDGQEGPIIARVDIERGPGALAAPLDVEFIGNCRTGKPEILAVESLEPHFTAAATSVLPAHAGADGKSCFLRVRVRLKRHGPDLMAYSNPIRFYLDERGS